MNGIVSYGAYVPHHVLERSAIAEALGTRPGKGRRSVAAFDEDSTSLGVEAARFALDGTRPTAVYLATSEPAYADKTNAAAIHAALRLERSTFAVDLAGSVRAAAGALRAASQERGLAVLSDVRGGLPSSADERDGGDAAAAFAFGSGDEVVAEIVASASETAEFLDRWRLPGQPASRVWEERFGARMYAPLIRSAVADALAGAGLERCDHVVVSSPHKRAAAAARRALEGDQGAAELDAEIGFAGAAHAGIGLADVLDRAAPGDSILVVLAADGCDAWVLRATEALGDRRPRLSVRAQLEGRQEVSYGDYLTWRGQLVREPPRRPDPDRPASPAAARTEAWKYGFVGSRCTSCGAVQLPPQRVCVSCGRYDSMVEAPLANVPGTVTTCTVDRLAFSLAPPTLDVVVDFDGGGRFQCEMADAEADRVRPGDRVEMSFRRFYTSEGIHNYFWKARPTRGA